MGPCSLAPRRCSSRCSSLHAHAHAQHQYLCNPDRNEMDAHALQHLHSLALPGVVSAAVSRVCHLPSCLHACMLHGRVTAMIVMTIMVRKPRAQSSRSPSLHQHRHCTQCELEMQHLVGLREGRWPEPAQRLVSPKSHMGGKRNPIKGSVKARANHQSAE